MYQMGAVRVSAGILAHLAVSYAVVSLTASS